MMAATNLAGDTFPGEEFLDGWFGDTDWDTHFDANSWPDGAILRFIAATPVPLPGTLPLVLSGLGALVAWRRRSA
jgi:MYXO-CTERM domain-containing protein